MRGALILVGLMLASPMAAAADDIEPLDGAFLEYLANLEGDDDNWTLLEDGRPPADVDAEADESAKKAKQTRKPKEPAQPAVEER